jgi:uncharacterized alkaline shock family protein YloU
MTKVNRVGRIQISPHAITTIASDAVLQCYGVVGMAHKNLFGSLADLLQSERWRRGVEVRVNDGQITVDLYVIIQYGTRISEVAHGVMHGVKYALERTLGVSIAQVNVHVQGLGMLNDTR